VVGYKFVINTITRLVANDTVHSGLGPAFYKKSELDDDALFSRIMQIPGVKESTFTREEFDLLK
jgi:hypothetical protein